MNKQIEEKEIKKTYYQKNKKKLDEYSKNYYEKNKIKLKYSNQVITLQRDITLYFL